jgi:hypothetical protein
MDGAASADGAAGSDVAGKAEDAGACDTAGEAQNINSKTESEPTWKIRIKTFSEQVMPTEK